jgi:hypothetical protein
MGVVLATSPYLHAEIKRNNGITTVFPLWAFTASSRVKFMAL